MSQVVTFIWYYDACWWCRCPWCEREIEVTEEERERFINGEPVYFICTDEECGNSFYLEK